MTKTISRCKHVCSLFTNVIFRGAAFVLGPSPTACHASFLGVFFSSYYIKQENKSVVYCKNFCRITFTKPSSNVQNYSNHWSGTVLYMNYMQVSLNSCRLTLIIFFPVYLWPSCAADADIIFLCCSLFCLFSLPNLSRRRLDVYHTSTHDVALMRI